MKLDKSFCFMCIKHTFAHEDNQSKLGLGNNFVGSPSGVGTGTSAFSDLYTAVSRKFVKNKVHATIPKGNMGYDQYTVSNDCSCRTYFCYFPSALANIYQWPPVRFF